MIFGGASYPANKKIPTEVGIKELMPLETTNEMVIRLTLA